MNLLSQRSAWLICPRLLLAQALMMGWLPVASLAHLEDRIVAVVNTELIMLSDVKREFQPEQNRLSKEYQGNELAQRLKTAESMALTKLIERKLQLQDAKAKHVEVSDQEVKVALEQMKRQGTGLDGSNPADFKDVREQLILMRVTDQQIRGNITIGDAELRRYYQEHRDRFALPEEYQLSQIIIEVRSPEDLADALTKARRAMDELKRGEKFAEVAMQYSDGLNAMQGGRLGAVRQGELLPALERAVAHMTPGGISDIIESPAGLHIIRLDEKKPKQFRPYEQVRYQVQELVYQRKSEGMYQSWLSDLKNKAYIEIKF